MNGQRLWVWSPDGTTPDLPAPFVAAPTRELGGHGTAPVVVPASRWTRYVDHLAAGGDEPEVSVLYVDDDISLPQDTVGLVDAIVARGDSEGLARAVDPTRHQLLSGLQDLPSEVLQQLASGTGLHFDRLPEDVRAALASRPPLAAEVRRAASLEVSLRQLATGPLGAVATVELRARAPALLAAAILLAWVRQGVRPKAGPPLRGGAGDASPTLDEIEVALQAGEVLEADLFQHPLSFRLSDSTALAVAAPQHPAVLSVVRRGQTVWKRPVHPEPARLPLDLLQPGDRVELHLAPPEDTA